jgi:hypothetical protein
MFSSGGRCDEMPKKCVLVLVFVCKREGTHCTVIRNKSKVGLNFNGVSRVLLSQTLDPSDGHSWTNLATV